MSQYPALEYLFSAYFHQDWASEHADSGAVMTTFCRNETAEQVADVRHELQKLLAESHDEDELKALLHGPLQSAWAPGQDGPGYRQWLQQLHQQLLTT